MSLMLLDSGALVMLGKFFNTTLAASNDFTLHLFVNDATPDDTYDAYVEAGGGGYAPKTLVAGNFSPQIIGGIPQVSYPTQVFTFSGPLTAYPNIYGHYIMDGDGWIIYAERAATPFTPAIDGDMLNVNVVIQLSKGTPA